MGSEIWLVVAIGAVAMSVGLVAYASASLVGTGKRLDKNPRTSARWGRTAAILESVPVPALIGRRWTDEGAERRLGQAGVPLSFPGYVGMRWLVLWIGGGSAVLLLASEANLVHEFAGLLCVAAGLFGPDIWLQVRLEQRRAEIDLALPDFLDRLALGLEAGLSFSVAFRRTSSNFRGLLGDEMRRGVRQLDRGHSKSVALDEIGLRNPSGDLQAFVASVKQAEALGTSLAETLRVQTSLLRARRRRRAEEASRRLPVLIVFPLVFFFLPALLIVYLAPPLLHLFLGR